MTEIAELIERLEKAPGPDRQLDMDIHESIVGLRMYESFHTWPDGKVSLRYYADPTGPTYGVLPRYTSSIDAALTLVPYHREWCVGSASLLGCFWAEIVSPTERHIAKGAVMPAIALCIAALKARMALTTAKGGDQ